MHDSRSNHFAQSLFRRLPGRYDVLAEVLSFGQNRRWRGAAVARVAPSTPQRVLDVATGTAGVALALVDRTPAFIVGLDLSDTMLARGRQNVDNAHRSDQIVLSEGRAEELPFPDETFDAVLFSYLLRYVDDPAATLRELARVLKPGAPMASLDFFVPPRPWYRAVWWCYTRWLLPVGGMLGGRSWMAVGRFLGPNISQHVRRYPLARLIAAWHSADLVEVDASIMSFGAGLVMWGRKTTGPGPASEASDG